MSKHLRVKHEPKRRLSLLDRLRGWHWEDRRAVYHGETAGVAVVKVRNWCGCVI